MASRRPGSGLVSAAGTLALLMLSVPARAAAQGENHWYNQFGDHSFLLGGAVIGGVSDLGAVFYNPGRLAAMEDAGLFLRADGFQRVSVTVADGRGPGRDLTVTDWAGSPSFTAGAFTLPFWPRQTFAYSYLTRRSRKTELSLSRSAAGDILPTLPGTDAFVGSVDLDSRVKEDWFGLSWATGLGRGIDLGISAFGTVSSRDHLISLDSRASSASGTAAWLKARRYKWSAWGLLFKAGLAVNRGPFDLGLTVTSPQIGLTARGDVRYEDLLVGVDTTSDGVADDGFTAVRQEGLPAKLKSPMAVGAGVSWRVGPAVVHVSAEWYSAVAGYTNLESDTIYDSAGRSVGTYRVVSGLTSVLAAGGGVRWRFGDAVSAFASVAWDPSPEPRSPAPPAASEVASTAYLLGDVLHLGGGISARTHWFELTAGLIYSGADERLSRPFPLTPGASPSDAGRPLVVTTTTLRFLIGVSIYVVSPVREP